MGEKGSLDKEVELEVDLDTVAKESVLQFQLLIGNLRQRGNNMALTLHILACPQTTFLLLVRPHTCARVWGGINTVTFVSSVRFFICCRAH